MACRKGHRTTVVLQKKKKKKKKKKAAEPSESEFFLIQRERTKGKGEGVCGEMEVREWQN